MFESDLMQVDAMTAWPSREGKGKEKREAERKEQRR